MGWWPESARPLYPIGISMLWVATRSEPPVAAVWLVILGNAGWVLGSVAVLALFDATGLGSRS
jgi:hypothetical protein